MAFIVKMSLNISWLHFSASISVIILIRIKNYFMKFNAFNKLHKEQQLEFLWDKGFLMGERNGVRYSYLLYSIDTFYVELRYYNNSLHGYNAWRYKKEFDPYK